LGGSLANACKTACKDFKQMVIVGGDCVSINKEHIEEAFQYLQSSDCVVAPAEDGGFVLVGCTKKAFVEKIFEDIVWGSSVVFDQLVQNLNNYNVYTHYMERLWDIDDYEDIQRLKNLSIFQDFM